MGRTGILASLVAIVAIFALGVTLVAQDNTGSQYGTQSGTSGTVSSQPSTSGPSTGASTSACGGNWSSMSDNQMMQQDTSAMQGAGMPANMQMRRKMLMSMQVNADDPQALLAMRSDLSLSQDQIDKLQKVEDRARKDARDALNDSQKQQIAALEGTPMSMVAMCREMSSHGWTGQQGTASTYGAGTTGTSGAGASGAINVGPGGATGTVGTGTTGSMTGTTGATTGTSGAYSGTTSGTGTSGAYSGTTGTQSGTGTSGAYSGTTGGQGGAMSGGTSGNVSGMSDQQIMQQETSSMQSAGISTSMQMRRKMLMGMQVNADDPQALLALKSDLNLTQDQTDKLQRIWDKSRNDARDVLKDNQKQQIAGLGGTPMSMVSMCREMSNQGWTGGVPGSAPMGTGTTGAAGTTTPGATGAYSGTTGGATTGTAGSTTGTMGSTTGTTGSMTGTTGATTGTAGSMTGTTGSSSSSTSGNSGTSSSTY